MQTHSFPVNLESLRGCFQKYLTFSLLCKIDYHNKMTAVSENAHIELTKHPIVQKRPPPPQKSDLDHAIHWDPLVKDRKAVQVESLLDSSKKGKYKIAQPYRL